MQFRDAALDLARIHAVADRYFDECLHKLADIRPLNELGQFRLAVGGHQDREVSTSFGRADDRGDQVRYFIRRWRPAIIHLLPPNRHSHRVRRRGACIDDRSLGVVSGISQLTGRLQFRSARRMSERLRI